ncbi:MAG TPA: hypothetical protein DD706_06845 [Nitrospiraceae bacterium]|nr:hypothetical protein [Nitrospiraceae bacterium]
MTVLWASVKQAKLAIKSWMHCYNEKRPHQALQYRSPRQFRQEQCLQVT